MCKAPDYMKCDACMQETLLPFRCQHCGGQFCGTHRLPENHSCPKIEAARTHHQDQVMTNQAYGSYNYSYVYGQDTYKRKNHISTSPKELKHVSIAAALVIGIGFSIGLYGNTFHSFPFEWTIPMMAAFAVVMVASFLTHELAHKFVAQKRGLWAEFRLTTWGALLTFASVFLPFRMIAPGAMMIGGTLQKNDDIVKISIAGPLTNLIFASTFLAFAFTLPVNIDWIFVLLFAAYINAFMAIFNLIPFGVLDGYKIFSFNKKLWALAFIPSLIMTITTFLFI
jgi:Zn-dependent protease